MIVVGISGLIGHGKDVVAQYLRRSRRFNVLRMSDALKEEVCRRLRRTLKEVVRASVHQDYARGEVPPYLLLRRERDADEAWWDRRLVWECWDYKRPIVRRLLQEYGTEVRRADDPDYWVKRYAAEAVRLDLVATPDVRFENEARTVRALNGLLVKVVRPGYGAASETHVSEDFANTNAAWDHVFTNDGSLADLELKVEVWATEYLDPRIAAR